jgi:hypothetical protein
VFTADLSSTLIATRPDRLAGTLVHRAAPALPCLRDDCVCVKRSLEYLALLHVCLPAFLRAITRVPTQAGDIALYPEVARKFWATRRAMSCRGFTIPEEADRVYGIPRKEVQRIAPTFDGR